MTLVMVWAEASDRWWLISNSRISGNRRPLTDSGAKIVEIPATLYAAPKLDAPTNHRFGDDVLGEPIKETTLGFAFAGSVLVAKNIPLLWPHSDAQIQKCQRLKTISSAILADM